MRQSPTAHRVNPVDLGLWVAPGFRDRESPCRCILPGCDHVGATACPAALPVVKALLRVANSGGRRREVAGEVAVQLVPNDVGIIHDPQATGRAGC